MHPPFSLVRTLWLALLIACFAPNGVAQMQGKINGKPIGVGYAKDLSEVSAFEYLKKLTQRLNHDSTMVKSAPSQDVMKDMVPAVDEQITGQAFYMVQGLVPSFDAVYFRRVADVDDAKRTLKARGRNMGGDNGSELIDEGNGCFRFVRTWSYEFAPPGKQTAQEYVDSVSSGGQSGNNKTSWEAVEKDGKQMVKQTSRYEESYRFYDNMLFSGGGESLFEMELPTASELTRGVQGGKDMGIDAYFDRIPSGIKTLGWNMLNSTAGTMMQQRDDEEQTQADVRSRSMQLGLDLVKALMFDVQEAQGWWRWANDDDPSMRGQLLFETRRNAELQKQLETASSGISRFAPILRDEAVATFHTCLTLPEASATFTALANWLPVVVEQEISSDASVVQAARKLALTLEDLADTPTMELCAKAGWSQASDGVFYGGIRVGNNEGLIDAVVTLLQATNPPDGIMETVEKNGLAALQIKLPQSQQEFITRSSGLKLSHIYVTQGASCLWFAIGNENAIEIIRQSIARCESGGSAGRTPVLSAEVDGEAWLALPQDDPVGVGGLLMYLDENVAAFPPGPMMMMMRFGNSQKPTPFLQRCIDLGGNHRASLQVVADRSGLKVDAELGEVIGNYMLIRMIDSQEQMMQRSMRANMEESDAVKETAEAAPAKQ